MIKVNEKICEYFKNQLGDVNIFHISIMFNGKGVYGVELKYIDLDDKEKTLSSFDQFDVNFINSII
jgi:hypothetical protein